MSNYALRLTNFLRSQPEPQNIAQIAQHLRMSQGEAFQLMCARCRTYGIVAEFIDGMVRYSIEKPPEPEAPPPKPPKGKRVRVRKPRVKKEKAPKPDTPRPPPRPRHQTITLDAKIAAAFENSPLMTYSEFILAIGGRSQNSTSMRIRSGSIRVDKMHMMSIYSLGSAPYDAQAIENYAILKKAEMRVKQVEGRRGTYGNRAT